MIRALPSLSEGFEMKRVLMIVTVFMATWLLQSVQAEGHMYSIEELNRMGQPEWKEHIDIPALSIYLYRKRDIWYNRRGRSE